MKRTIILMALLAISVASWSRVITDSIKSNVLKATVKVNIYLPEEFDRQPQKNILSSICHSSRFHICINTQAGMAETISQILSTT